jgi:hypothetical protein
VRTNRGNGLQEHRDYKQAHAAVPLATDAFKYQDLGSDHAVYLVVFAYFLFFYFLVYVFLMFSFYLIIMLLQRWSVISSTLRGGSRGWTRWSMDHPEIFV